MTHPAVTRAQLLADYLAANLGTGRLPLRRDPEAVEPWDAGLEPEHDNGPWLSEGRARDDIYGRRSA